MSTLEWLIAVPYFGGGLLVWPVALLIGRSFGKRHRWLRMVFLVTLAVLGLPRLRSAPRE